MSRVGPSIWTRLWNNVYKAITREPDKFFVGTDSAGNRFYEYRQARNARSNVKRGYDNTSLGQPKPTLEWEAWLKGTRRFPPSDEEIQLNNLKQLKQLAQDSITEKRAPKIESKGRGAGDIDHPKNYPKYSDLEVAPGTSNTENEK